MLLAAALARRGEDRSGVGRPRAACSPLDGQSLLAEPEPSVGSVPGDQLRVAPLFRDPPTLEHDDQIHGVEVDQAMGTRRSVRSWVQRLMARRTSRSVEVSRLAVGSSSRTSGASVSITPARPSRCRSPADMRVPCSTIARALVKDPPLLVLDEPARALIPRAHEAATPPHPRTHVSTKTFGSLPQHGSERGNRGLSLSKGAVHFPAPRISLCSSA